MFTYINWFNPHPDLERNRFRDSKSFAKDTPLVSGGGEGQDSNSQLPDSRAPHQCSRVCSSSHHLHHSAPLSPGILEESEKASAHRSTPRRNGVLLARRPRQDTGEAPGLGQQASCCVGRTWPAGFGSHGGDWRGGGAMESRYCCSLGQVQGQGDRGWWSSVGLRTVP